MAGTVRTHQSPSPPVRNDSPPILVRRIDAIVVLEPSGDLDRFTIERLHRAVIESREPIIIDLNRCALIDPSGLARIAEEHKRSPELDVRLACRHGPLHDALVRMGIADELTVLEDLHDA